MNLNRLFDDKASLASLFTAAALLAAFRLPTFMLRSVSYCIWIIEYNLKLKFFCKLTANSCEKAINGTPIWS